MCNNFMNWQTTDARFERHFKVVYTCYFLMDVLDLNYNFCDLSLRTFLWYCPWCWSSWLKLADIEQNVVLWILYLCGFSSCKSGQYNYMMQNLFQYLAEHASDEEECMNTVYWDMFYDLMEMWILAIAYLHISQYTSGGKTLNWGLSPVLQ
jgi:hypothetical protein